MNGDRQYSIDASGHAQVRGDLTLDTVASVYRQAEESAAKGVQPSEMDLGGVTRVDSSGLALILEWQARARRIGQTLKISNAPDDLLSLAGLCEAAGLLELNGRTA